MEIGGGLCFAQRVATVATPKTSPRVFSFYEFFAGGGMARMGLVPRWKCLFAK